LRVEDSSDMIDRECGKSTRGLSASVNTVRRELDKVGMGIECRQSDARVQLCHSVGNLLLFLGNEGAGCMMENPIRRSGHGSYSREMRDCWSKGRREGGWKRLRWNYRNLSLNILPSLLREETEACEPWLHPSDAIDSYKLRNRMILWSQIPMAEARPRWWFRNHMNHW
jgi:hypothetical protein